MSDPAEGERVTFLSELIGANAIVRTHISVVILGPERVFKLKRAVRLPYLDFSTPERRLQMCRREVALNRQFAPRLYLGVRRLTRDADGRLALDGAGDDVDAVVEMRRFDADALFDTMARAGRLTKELIEKLAGRIAAAHDAAPPDPAHGGRAAMDAIVNAMQSSLREAAPAPMNEVDAHLADLREALTGLGARIDERRAHGKVRACHGDLNLRNICLYENEPTPFDCIEFSEEISTIDVLYDVAFLLMDLWRFDLRDFAGLALNRYLDARLESEDAGLALLPFFMSLRATIRAHVEASQGHAQIARVYFDLAHALLAPASACVIAIGGFSGAGKSSVAGDLATRLPPAPGARIFNSDRIRKRMFGAAPSDRLSPEAYKSDVSQKVYAELFASAARVACAGWPVIVDAVFDRPQDRAAIEDAARQAGAPFFGVWLDIDLAQRLARVDKRVNDVSDATREVLQAQMARETGDIAWLRIDAGRALNAIVEEIADAVSLAGEHSP